MLKRSFAEFHAQRSAPGLAEALAKGRAALQRLNARPWPASPLGVARRRRPCAPLPAPVLWVPIAPFSGS